jgi:large subunit ribosomal protein L31e
MLRGMLMSDNNIKTEENRSTAEVKTEEKAKKEKEEIVEEHIYTIPLKQAWIAPIKKRSPRAMNVLKDFLRKHMKIDDFVISQEVNERIWSRGIEGAPRKIRVRAVKDKEGVITVYMAKGG